MKSKINIFLDDARTIYDIRDERDRISRKMKKLNKEVSKKILEKDTKDIKELIDMFIFSLLILTYKYKGSAVK